MTAVATSFSLFRRFLGFCLHLCLLLGLAAAVALGMATLLPGPATSSQTIIVPRQSGIEAIGALLAEQGQVYHPLQFSVPAALLAPHHLRAGEYVFATHLSVLDIILLLRSGKVVVHKLTVPEGLTNAEIGKLLTNESRLTEELAPLPPEGTLYPATYNFSYGDNRNALLEQMQKRARSLLQELWEKREADLPLATAEQALTLASIVEKETGVPEERPRIAGVFMNRLRSGMKLQSDPTVIYAVTNGDVSLKRALTSADLICVSPYNTYVIEGLPPAPIANPGRAALEAVLHPEKHDYLYFVADGSGGHAFAKTLEEHNRNVSAWRKLRGRE